MPPEVRFDPLGRRYVLLAPERARRGAPPIDVQDTDPAPCDFCGGYEQRTPPETFAVRPDGSPPDTPGWAVRVVPNLYAATPFHEVVVHTPDHYERFEEQDVRQRADVLGAYRARLRAARVDAAVVVWNRGRASGASRSHPHGQIFGLDRTPPTLERESETFSDDPCALCRIADTADLVVEAPGTYRVVAHPVPFVADELLIVPPCTPRFDDLEDEDLREAADVFASTIGRVVSQFGERVPFNLVIHTAPRAAERFHWHAHLMPRTAVWGGLEMGAELPIVAANPHDTAVRMRAASSGGNTR